MRGTFRDVSALLRLYSPHQHARAQYYAQSVLHKQIFVIGTTNDLVFEICMCLIFCKCTKNTPQEFQHPLFVNVGKDSSTASSSGAAMATITQPARVPGQHFLGL